MDLVFHKMHGAGNDFVLLDLRRQDYELTSAMACSIADRHRGVGCDQILVVMNPLNERNSARYEIWNSDGSRATQCGNGARCIGLFLSMDQEVASKDFTLESPVGVISLHACTDGEFELEMGVPDFSPNSVPISLTSDNGQFTLDSPWGILEFAAVSMGNPHALVVVDDINQPDISSMGEFISKHPAFPDGCNAGFAEVINREKIRLRVHERGTGETLACGSGACAAVAILRQSNQVDNVVDVLLPGGTLVIKWLGTGQQIRMKGPAKYVCMGTISG